jgi:hypothetical protein
LRHILREALPRRCRKPPQCPNRDSII